MDVLIRPKTIAVIGASPNRETLGNVALKNLANYKYQGRVIPVHGEAKEIEGLSAVGSIEDLPANVDVVLASVPAGGVADVIRRLDAKGVPTAIINTAGFSKPQEAELRSLVNTSRVLMHGPNCMGFINLSDATPIYTGGITPRIKRGPVALIAQSGSAAISVINSSVIGFSKVVTIGSEYRVTGADYLRWFATDDDTTVIGLVLESIPDADRFADAVERVYAAGKSMVLLKVGRSTVGAQATLAHTGALVRNNDAFMAFAARHGVPVVNDYEELIACLEALAINKRRPAPGKVGLMGISGGETALACDICDEIDLELAVFSEKTAATVRELLPGVPGNNPLDVGGSVGRGVDATVRAMKTIMDAPEVGMGVVLQDMMASLPESSHRNYTGHLATVTELSSQTEKPLIVVSTTSEIMSERLLKNLDNTDIPPIRGLRNGLAAAKAMLEWYQREVETRRLADRRLTPERTALRKEVSAIKGPLPAPLIARLLASYDIPVVKSAVVKTAEDALAKSRDIGFPMVVKVVSADVPHRSDVGAVQLGIKDEAGLSAAIALIEKNVREKKPGARIEGFELQEELIDCVQAMVGYQDAPPYGALTIVGTGGVMVELENDKILTLSPATPEEVTTKLQTTRLAKALGGYRNLIAKTDVAPLATLVSRLSELAVDFSDVVPECDLNPVLIRKGSGDVRVVDALFIGAGKGE